MKQGDILIQIVVSVQNAQTRRIWNSSWELISRGAAGAVVKNAQGLSVWAAWGQKFKSFGLSGLINKTGLKKLPHMVDVSTVFGT